jgi:hypothetical protein
MNTADKDRALAHYVPMAAQAALLKAKRRRPLRRPDLSAITGGQYDRRRAVVMLGYLEEQAQRDGDSATAMAMWSAAYDLITILARAAEDKIAESVDMPFAHGDTYQQALARMMATRPGVSA